MLTVIDEYTRDSPLIYVARKITAYDVLEHLADLFIVRGTPAFLRPDDGPEFVACKLALSDEGHFARRQHCHHR